MPTYKRIMNQRLKATSTKPKAFIRNNPFEAKNDINRTPFGFADTPYDSYKNLTFQEYTTSKHSRIDKDFIPSPKQHYLKDPHLYLNAFNTFSTFTTPHSSKNL